MLPTSNDAVPRRCLVALAAAVLMIAACGDGVDISLQLRTAQNRTPAADASLLRSLTVIIDNGDIEDRASFALNRADQVAVPPLSVDRTAPFNIEVWGCNREACDAADVILRGCTPTALDVSDRDDTVVVAIEMHDFRDDALRRCPGIGD